MKRLLNIIVMLLAFSSPLNVWAQEKVDTRCVEVKITDITAIAERQEREDYFYTSSYSAAAKMIGKILFANSISADLVDHGSITTKNKGLDSPDVYLVLKNGNECTITTRTFVNRWSFGTQGYAKEVDAAIRCINSNKDLVINRDYPNGTLNWNAPSVDLSLFRPVMRETFRN